LDKRRRGRNSIRKILEYSAEGQQNIVVDDKKTLGIPTAGYKVRTAEFQGQDEGRILCRMTVGRKAAEYLRRGLQNNAQEDRKKYRKEDCRILDKIL
jgi:hypothetical protein